MLCDNGGLRVACGVRQSAARAVSVTEKPKLEKPPQNYSPLDFRLPAAKSRHPRRQDPRALPRGASTFPITDMLSAAAATARFVTSVSTARLPRATSTSCSHRAAPAPSRRLQHHCCSSTSLKASAMDDASSDLAAMQADFDALIDATALYDEQRDTVIKRGRDITKAAKVAVYCLHRGELDKADAQIALSEKIADELLPIIDANPTLRHGRPQLPPHAAPSPAQRNPSQPW